MTQTGPSGSGKVADLASLPADSLMATRYFLAVQLHASRMNFPTKDRWKIVATIAVATICIAAAGVGSTTAQDNQAPQTFRDCSDCPEMVVVPSGGFLMGSSDAENERVREMKARDLLPIPLFLGRLLVRPLLSEQPQHSVTIPRAFGMGKYPVTRGEFAAFVRESGYLAGKGCTVHSGYKYPFRDDGGWANPGFSQTDRDPVVCLSWNDAQAYAAWLNKKLTGQIPPATAGPYRLPSEAGSTRHAPEHRLCTGGVIRSARAMLTVTCAAANGTANERPRLTPSVRIRSDSPTCLVTLLSGRKIVRTRIMKGRRLTAALGQREAHAKTE